MSGFYMKEARAICCTEVLVPAVPPVRCTSMQSVVFIEQKRAVGYVQIFCKFAHSGQDIR